MADALKAAMQTGDQAQVLALTQGTVFGANLDLLFGLVQRFNEGQIGEPEFTELLRQGLTPVRGRRAAKASTFSGYATPAQGEESARDKWGAAMADMTTPAGDRWRDASAFAGDRAADLPFGFGAGFGAAGAKFSARSGDFESSTLFPTGGELAALFAASGDSSPLGRYAAAGQSARALLADGRGIFQVKVPVDATGTPIVGLVAQPLSAKAQGLLERNIEVGTFYISGGANGRQIKVGGPAFIKAVKADPSLLQVFDAVYAGVFAPTAKTAEKIAAIQRFNNDVLKNPAKQAQGQVNQIRYLATAHPGSFRGGPLSAEQREQIVARSLLPDRASRSGMRKVGLRQVLGTNQAVLQSGAARFGLSQIAATDANGQIVAGEGGICDPRLYGTGVRTSAGYAGLGAGAAVYKKQRMSKRGGGMYEACQFGSTTFGPQGQARLAKVTGMQDRAAARDAVVAAMAGSGATAADIDDQMAAILAGQRAGGAIGKRLGTARNARGVTLPSGAEGSAQNKLMKLRMAAAGAAAGGL